MMIKHILSIPKAVVLYQIVPFLDLKSLVRLDAASTSHAHRQNVMEHVFAGVEVSNDFIYNKRNAKWLLSHGVLLQHVVILNNTLDKDLDTISIPLAKVTSLELAYCQPFSDNVLQSFLRKCGTIVLLDLTELPWVVDNTMQLLSSFFYSLVKLHLWDLPNITDKGTARVLCACKQLQHIRLFCCAQLGDLVVQSLGSMIEFSHFQCADISEESVLALITRSGNNLRILELEQCYDLTDQALQTISSSCPNIHMLSTNYCDNIGDAAFCALFRTCHTLTHLSVEGIELTAATLDTFCQCLNPNLLYLGMTHTELSDTHIAKITSRAIAINSLILPYNRNLTNHALITIGKNLPCLTSFEIANSNFDYTGLAHGCPNLISFDVLCQQFTDECFREIAAHCKYLARLTMSAMLWITDVGLAYVAEHSVHLKNISVRGTSVTQEAVMNLLYSCKNITNIMLPGHDINTVSQPLMQIVRQRNIECVIKEFYAF